MSEITTISLRITSDLAGKIDEMAKILHQNRSAFIRECVEFKFQSVGNMPPLSEDVVGSAEFLMQLVLSDGGNLNKEPIIKEEVIRLWGIIMKMQELQKNQEVQS